MKEWLLQIFTWWNGQTLGTRFHTWRTGKKVGEDQYGNIYYTNADRTRRWVIYNGPVEASAIPSGWHGWMHHRVDTPPADEVYVPRSWEKPSEKNHTGTDEAYRPAGSLLRPEKDRPRVTGEYDAWTP
ncbi:NADH:ubiquinone oxidoreductase subunit NDUFA12 [Fulvimarina sp. 2208YS6-2-32]|uniref:NADH:ubiquinone oxidoreductase subunit NDUFA12 n=1 Tax=Fulvimarina uroteuthidis TaxID=3098149 RepID=A0ABU5I5J0_9HYPH|nr:NADH:ubiquinone oxidoreductase subunit NDUFA12 [Fulvimarina sp. 2208YS6-2-32]MDY8110644.1 NADH:ubiquinone oxidoreductase subunit NDUFA12 [Fulvimarina sp. 2208YS6-2-32]